MDVTLARVCGDSGDKVKTPSGLGNFSVAVQPAASQEKLTSIRTTTILILLLLLFGVCHSNKHCPSARCAYAANAVGKDLDIFALGTVSLNHIFTQPKIVNNICSYS
jgi:hypothetical protein